MVKPWNAYNRLTKVIVDASFKCISDFRLNLNNYIAVLNGI